MNEKKVKFNQVYADLPLGLRRDIVVVLDVEGPMTWNSAFVEVYNETEVGEKILNKLSDMGII